jgi:N6-adenosine-specific RNA methylase IME4
MECQSVMDWPTGQYDVVLADPPWSYTGQQAKWGAAAKFYGTMPDDWIHDLDIGGLLSPRGVLFLWATCPRLDAAMECIGKWGLTFRGVAFCWVKTKKTDPLVPIGAQGVRPSIVKPTTELVLAASRVRSGRPMPLADEGVRQVVLAPKQEHSTKPAEVHERIEALYPTARKIELFARRPRPGWDAWGNEAQGRPEDG